MGSGSASRPIEVPRGLFRPSDPWILLSLAVASFRGPASLRGLISAADYINHAIPTRAEVEGGLNRLARAGLVSTSCRGFSLTSRSRRMLLKLEGNTRSILRQWTLLDRRLPRCRVAVPRPPRFRLTPMRYRLAVEDYRSSMSAPKKRRGRRC